MKLEIRSCSLSDFSDVVRLFRQLWPDIEPDVNALQTVYADALSSPVQKLIVGTMDEKVVGFCSLTIKNNFWQAGRLGNVDELVVDEHYRGKGIGKELMRHIQQLASDHQCKRVELDSSFHRQEAHRFYESIGFKRRAYLFTKELNNDQH